MSFNRIIHISLVSMAGLAMLLPVSTALARNVTITYNRVYQTNGNPLDPYNLDLFSWADFAPDLELGGVHWPSDNTARASYVIGDTRDAYPTNWSHTWSVSDTSVPIVVSLYDDDRGGDPTGQLPDWQSVRISSDGYFYVHFWLDVTTGQITNYNNSGPQAPSIVSGTPISRQYTTRPNPDLADGAQVWFTIQIEDTDIPSDFTLTANPTGWASSSTVSVSGGADLLSGFDHFEFWLNGVKKYTDSSTSASHIDTQQGGNTWTVKAYDRAGNHRDKTVYTYIDTSAPNDFTLTATPSTWTKNSVTVNYSGGGDPLSGFNRFEVYDGGSYWFTSTNTTGSFSVTGEGLRNVDMYEYDNLGYSRAKSVTVYIDNTLPTGSAPVPSSTTWTSSDVSISFSATDALSGMDHYEESVDAGVYAICTSPYWMHTEGQHTVHIKALDKAGNGKIWDVPMLIDRTAPVSFTPTANPVSWTNVSFITVYFTTTDPLSGIQFYTVAIDGGAYVRQTSPYNIDVSSFSAGAHTIHVKAVDNVGNTTAPMDVLIYTDRVMPTGSININSGNDYTTDPNVTLSLTYGDLPSGLAGIRFSNDGVSWSNWESPVSTKSWALSSNDGVKTVYYQVEDNAGNVSQYSDTVTLDAAAPVATVGLPTPIATRHGPISFPVQFNQPVTGFTSTSNIQINSYSGDVTVGTVAITGSGSQYTVTLSNISGNGELGITVKAGAALDHYLRPSTVSAAGPGCFVSSVWTIGIAKLASDGTEIALNRHYLYLVQSTFGYIENANRSAGIRIEAPTMPKTLNSTVDIVGIMRTNESGERYVELEDLNTREAGTIRPYGVNGAALANPLVEGMYVTIWGKVLDKTETTATITDGGGNYKVISVRPISAAVGQFTSISGAAGRYLGYRAIYTQE